MATISTAYPHKNIPAIAYDVLQWRFEEVNRRYFHRWNEDGKWQAAFLGEEHWPYKLFAHLTDTENKRILIDPACITMNFDEAGYTKRQWAKVTREDFEPVELAQVDARLIHNICHATTTSGHKARWYERMQGKIEKARDMGDDMLVKRLLAEIDSSYWPMTHQDVRYYFEHKHFVDWDLLESDVKQVIKQAESLRNADVEKVIATFRKAAEEAEQAYRETQEGAGHRTPPAATEGGEIFLEDLDDEQGALEEQEKLMAFLEARIAADDLHLKFLQGKLPNTNEECKHWEALELYRLFARQYPRMDLYDLALLVAHLGYIDVNIPKHRDTDFHRKHYRSLAEEFLKRNDPLLLESIRKSPPTEDW